MLFICQDSSALFNISFILSGINRIYLFPLCVCSSYSQSTLFLHLRIFVISGTAKRMILCKDLNALIQKEQEKPPSDRSAGGGSCSFRILDCLTNTYMNVIIINTY